MKPSKIIDIPETIKDLKVEIAERGPLAEAKDLVKIIRLVEPEFPFKRWLLLSLKGFEPLGKGWDNIFKAKEICDAIEEANGDIPLTNDHYATVVGAVQAYQWNAGAAMQMISYFNAVKNAREPKKDQEIMPKDEPESKK